MAENTNQSIFIIQEQGGYDSNDYGGGTLVSQEQFQEWVSYNDVQALDQNGNAVDIVGGNDKLSVTDGGTTVGFNNVEQPSTGTGSTTYQTVTSTTTPGLELETGYFTDSRLTTAEQTRAINDLESLVEELVTRDPNLNTRAGVELAAATADEARKLLETNGYGLGLLPDYRAGLESVVNRAANYADFAQGTLQAAILTLESIKATALTDSTTTQWSKTTSQQAQAYIDSLPANQLAIINAAGLGQQFVDIIILGEGISPFSNYKYLTPTPYNVADTTFQATPIQAIIDNLTAAYIAQNGAISEEQYQSIVALVETQNSINVQRTETLEAVVENRNSIFNVVAGAESTTDTNLPALDQGDTAIQTIEVTANTSLSKAIRDSLGIDYQGPIVEKLIDRAINLGLNQIPGYSQLNSAVGTVNKVVKIGDITTNVDLSPAETALALARLLIPQVNLVVTGYNLLNGGDGFLGVGGSGGGGIEPPPTVNPLLLNPNIDPAIAGGTGFDGEDPPGDIVTINSTTTSEEDFTGTTSTGLLAVPEDLFTETDGGFNVLTDELGNQIESDLPEPVDENSTGYYPNGTPYDDNGNLNPGWAINPETGEPYFQGDLVNGATRSIGNSAESITQAAKLRAQSQASIEAQRKQANDGDWRVKLRLAGASNYLYNDPSLTSPQAGILWPLKQSDGVIFPYMPTIDTNYRANYTSYDLTHSNYRGYFYQNSYVDEISINATFTAQDTFEANYLLAVIHFFRSVTKMFYGQDAQRGSPPPLVFLQGLGEFQFNLHPCVVTNFSYRLPNDVDYIRANSINYNGTNVLQRRDRQTASTPFTFLSNIRLGASNLMPGATQPQPPVQTLGVNSPTYVPTKIDLSIGLLPIQTRQQVSQQFSVKEFANGNLLKGGFW
jgi:hypothetical protein